MMRLMKNIIAIEVPQEQICDNYEIINGQDDYDTKYLHYPSNVYHGVYQNYDTYELGEDNYSIIGITPSYDEIKGLDINKKYVIIEIKKLNE